MAPDQKNTKLPAKSAGKDEGKSPAIRKTSSGRPQEPALKCPRCDSPNTKFCYYNNYSLTQPRHFCKTCRRYWTRGGTLRSVPIGGGCRKSKKTKSSSRLAGESSDIGGLKFFQGISPAMDFQLGGINLPCRLPTPITGTFNQFNSCGISSPLMGFSTFPSSPGFKQGDGAPLGFQQIMGSGNVQNNLASSMESLSCINQDLQWKLQQQRLGMVFNGDNQKENSTSISSSTTEVALIEKPEPILFQNPDDSSRKENEYNGNLSNEWFFCNSSYYPTVPPSSSNNTINWNGNQAWTELTHYTSLPP